MDCELKDFGQETDEKPLIEENSSSIPAGSEVISSETESFEELERRNAPYVRRDVYGPMGRGALPLREKLLLGIAFLILVPIRFVAGMVILVIYYLICRVCTLLKDPNRENEQEDYAHMVGWRRAVVVRSGRFCSRAMLFVFGFYWIKESGLTDVHGELGYERGRPGAIVSNHVSYLDILYHMSSSFPSFVAKRSVAKLPLVGLISKCLGCVYVQRESKSSDSKGVSGVISERVLQAHQNHCSPMMLLFPEGTTTNGDFLLPFKTGAFLAKTPVLPVVLRYPHKRFSPAWDSISGGRHVLFLLCQFVNHIEVSYFPVYYPTQQEVDDPKFYANNLRKMMATEGNLTLSEIGLAEKRAYHAALNGNGSSRASSHQKED
ncbi:phospholipid/glycerol acyltransferase family protein isoform X2 [Wolffia australiana]